MPPIVLADGREEHLVRVELQVHVAHELFGVRPVERGEFARWADRGEHGDLVFVAVAGERAIALPVLRQSDLPADLALFAVFGRRQIELADRPLDEEQFVEIEKRVGQQGLVVQFVELARELGRQRDIGGGGGCHGCFHRAQPLQEFLAARIPLSERLCQIFDGLPQRRDIERAERRRQCGRLAGLVDRFLGRGLLLAGSERD